MNIERKVHEQKPIESKFKFLNWDAAWIRLRLMMSYSMFIYDKWPGCHSFFRLIKIMPIT